MKLGLNTSVRTDLQLRLSPQILQRIEVLQMPAMDLAQLVEQELQENESLEQADEPGDDEVQEEDLSQLYEESEWEERPVNRDAPTRMDVMEATAAAPVTLQDHLLRQLDESDLAGRERELAVGIVMALNERGWLEASFDELCGQFTPSATDSELEHGLHLVQALEPAGVGARDLTECLLLQLDQGDPEYDLLVTLVVQHLEDIARNKIPLIARDTGAGVERVLAAIDRISHLDPIPGRRFGVATVPHVRPDVVVTQVGADYEIALEGAGVPNVVVSRRYLDLLGDRKLDPDLRKHLREKIDGARSLIEAIEQRRHTLFRVASELVNRQAEALEHGPAALRPLRMQEIADALGVHVSTVSRAISGKYMQVPRGIVPMKSFFTGEVASRPGEHPEGASRTGVQELVREIIAGEDRRHPLSDEAIVKILKDDHGIDIARRTVTKYRKALKLGSSRARRVYGPS